MARSAERPEVLTTRGELAFGVAGHDLPVRRLVIATRNLDTDEIWVEVRVGGELVQRSDYDDWDVAQVDAVMLLLGVGPGGGQDERE